MCDRLLEFPEFSLGVKQLDLQLGVASLETLVIRGDLSSPVIESAGLQNFKLVTHILIFLPK